ncbi:hypothetical protein HB13667_07440 [Pseudomonas putida]|uniref:DnaT DNA-binding domain-containing protein n=1 Tax=Pseudomonas putida TaxID=303 RepID=A0A0P7DG14_PSEPU|nr:DnaT-like ssDNA-binding domain-containing protein [Pseudomonas putida]KPM67262.1 hypothetical protein HB13667_07440 [Pseudomonas putida]
MARARNIKPGLFSNELLAELPAFDRLLFIGMWCLADREGRLEDRPKRIKMELFPCDSYDVDDGLNSLAKAGFVNRYQVEGFTVIEIVNFQKHQNPHGSEKDSVLPDQNGYLTVNERKKNVVLPGKKRKVHVKEREFNVNSPLETVSSASHNALIPDSPNPDSLIPEEDQKNSLSAGEENSEPEGETQESEPAQQPVDPKAPVEMTLDWVPDAKSLKTYCVHYGVSVDLFTAEAIAPFTAHHESSGGLQTQGKWVQMLVKWVKNDQSRASNVRQFPSKPAAQPASRHHGFADRDYTSGLTQREDGSYAL